MYRKFLFLLSAIFTLAHLAGAQTTTTQNTSAAQLLGQLPDSEVVMFVDAKRLFSDALPLLTNNNQNQQAEINRQIERFRRQTGIDARSFDVFAVSLDFSPKITSLFPPKGTLTLDPVVIARSGASNSAQILAAARKAAQSSIGGNCEISKPNEIVNHRGVFIYAPTNPAATIPVHASQLFSRNLTTFCNLLAKDGALNLDFSDDILDGSCVAHQGEIRHERIKTNYKLRING